MSEEDKIIVSAKSKEQKLKEREEKRKKVSKGYYDIPEDEIQEIIIRAQSGEYKSQEYLLKVFSNFLEKYVNLLNKGHYDLRDYDIKCFVNLYVPSKDLRFKISKGRLDFKTYSEVTKTMQRIHNMVKRYNTEEDIRQTVNMTFTQCVSRYKRIGKIPFSGYLYRYFFFLLKRNVGLFLIGQLDLKSYPLITDDSVTSSISQDDAGVIHEAVAPTAPQLEDMLTIDDIDENWVRGIGVSFPFNTLDIHERQLLKWRYVDGLRPNKISEKTSDHPNTCRQHIKVIVRKIDSLMEEYSPLKD